MTRNVIICVTTEKAYLLKFCSSKKTQWYPKYKIKILDENINDMTGRQTFKVEIKDT